MKFIRKIMGFESRYSWVKWLRIGFAAAALLMALIFYYNFGGFAIDDGIGGLIISVIMFGVFFAPILLVIMVVSVLIGAVVGGVSSGRKQHKSLKESEATGSTEFLELDRARIKVQIASFLYFLAIGVAVLIGIAVHVYAETGLVVIYVIVAIIVFFKIGILVLKASSRYRDSFKDEIVKKRLEEVFKQVDFRPNEKIDESNIEESQLFTSYDRYNGNDYLSASCQNKRFIQSDVHLEEEYEATYTDDDGNTQTVTRYRTVFRGRLMIFDYDAISNEPVMVYSKSGSGYPFSKGIQTELDAFNRKFHVVSKDSLGALRILTPQVTEAIMLAGEKINFPISLSFINDKIYVAVAMGDSFEAAIVGDSTLSELRERVEYEIQIMVDLMEILYFRD
ncbi:uncharacterized protein DUF3137 [Alkalibaculum bacchi]|uniref:Uncharacterized protein DUF3137 n=1 Tax=Alkalibaculum bacchi TaxID=645887 RepID=A0A366IAI4_9FIRM|nr:DUF3137 domain-containing protein [Alkalibaculum bacchi]RBP66747.1 uncharacterized protein DUF3137 [Alkalibaculum bacchi]